MKCAKLCKTCRHCHPKWGNRSKDGSRIISSYGCGVKNSNIPKAIKQCPYYEEKIR